MEVSGCCGFRTGSPLSLRPPAALLSRARPPELISGGSAPPSPRGEPLPRLRCARPPGLLQPRAAGSSFLIRDILKDCRPDPVHSDPGPVHSDPGLVYPDPVYSDPVHSDPGLVYLDPGLVYPDPVYSDPDPVYSDPGHPESFQSGPEGDFQDKSSDSETRVGGASDPGMKKPRKARTAFSDQQLSRLERSFQKQKYLSVQDRMELAASLQLSDAQVKTWYQNRRTKWKRQASAGLELLAEAGRIFLPTHFLFPQAPPTPDLYLY